jgi:hypothetical protein
MLRSLQKEQDVNLKKLVVGLSMLFSLGTAFSQEAMLRVRCEADSEGADIYINGQIKGQCPTDLSLPAGQIKLKVQKNLDKGRYRTFERDFLLSSGALKRFDVELGAIQLNAEGQRLERERLEAERVAAQKKAEREAAAREEARLQAERDAPRLAAEKKAAEARAAAEAEAARRAAPGMVKKYMAGISSKDDKINPTTATLFTTYAPLFLPTSTTTDLVDGKNLAMTDPAVFGNPRSMMAKAVQQQQERQRDVARIEVAQR